MNLKGETLFCWSGGGMPGLDIHAGIWKALEERGIRSTLNAGTSAGAIMAALNSAGYEATRAECIIRGKTDEDVRDKPYLWQLRWWFTGWFLRHEPIRAILEALLPDRFQDLEKPLHVFCTDDRHGDSISVSGGPLVNMLLASMSISGVFPPMWGKFSDGGTTANLPLPPGWEKASQIFLLVAKRPIECRGKGGLGRLLWNVDVMAEDQVADTIRRVQAHGKRVCVIRPDVSIPDGMLHFDHDLINQAYDQAKARLEAYFK